MFCGKCIWKERMSLLILSLLQEGKVTDSNTSFGIQMTMPLPPCDLRVTTTVADKFFCRHSSVKVSGSLVPGAACACCPVRLIPCDSLRDIPTVEDLEQLSSESPPPSLVTKAWNFVTAVRDFVADGCTTVSNEVYEHRLQICDQCDQRVGQSCSKCGCQLALKARGRAFDCPLSKWTDGNGKMRP